MGGYKTKGHMTYKPEDPLKKAELMAVEMRRSRKRDLISLKRALHNTQTTEKQPVCDICCDLRKATLMTLHHSELHV